MEKAPMVSGPLGSFLKSLLAPGATSIHRPRLEAAFFQPSLDLVFREAEVRGRSGVPQTKRPRRHLRKLRIRFVPTCWQNKASSLLMEIRHRQGRGSEHAHTIVLALPDFPFRRQFP